MLEIANRFVFRKCSLVSGQEWIGKSRLAGRDYEAGVQQERGS